MITKRRISNRSSSSRLPARFALLLVTLTLATGTLRHSTTPAHGDTADQQLQDYRPRIDVAVENGLAFLSLNQNADGSFKSGRAKHAAITSLSVMAFLSKGHTPGCGPYGQVINRGIDFVLSCARRDGLIMGGKSRQGAMYTHCISTLMLSEVSGMVDEARQKKVDRVLPAAIQLILRAQNVKKTRQNDGGWRYSPTSRDSDISVSAWALMALRSARNNDALIPPENISRALRFVLACRNKNDGGFTYRAFGGSSGVGRTGAAMLCLELCGQHDTPVTRQAAKYILARPLTAPSTMHYHYALYYTSQAMFQLGGDAWTKWAGGMYDHVLAEQLPSGYWPNKRNIPGTKGGCYSTSMTILALTVSHRQLPIYQR